MIKKILIIFFIWRILLFIPVIIGDRVLPYRKGYEYTSPRFFTKQDNPIQHPLLSPWSNFDGIHYLLIASEGYNVNAGFFPLFPVVLRTVWSVFGKVIPFDPMQYILALIMSSTFALVAAISMYKLFRLDYSEKTALWSIVFFLLFPTSFFLATIYSESLFLLLCLLSFYFARKKQWLLAAILGGLATGTRFVGFALLPALVVEFLFQRYSRLSWQTIKRVFVWKEFVQIVRVYWSLVFVPMGLIGYMIYNWLHWGNPLFFIAAQGQFLNNRSVDTLVFPLQTLIRYLKIFISISPSLHEWRVALIELSSVLFVTTMLFVAWKKKVRLSYIVFSIISLLTPVLTGTFSALPRYILVLFPMYLAIAVVKDKNVQVVYAVTAGVLLFIFFLLFSKGYFIA